MSAEEISLFDIIADAGKRHHELLERWLKICGVTEENASDFYLGKTGSGLDAKYSLYRNHALIGTFVSVVSYTKE